MSVGKGHLGRRQSIQSHYAAPNLWDAIDGACGRAGIQVEQLSHDEVGALDEFHLMGRLATRKMATMAMLEPAERVLDIGSALGGPARTLSREFGCSVVALDMMPEYCLVASRLSRIMGLDAGVTVIQGEAAALPFRAHCYNVVWVQHVLMNIEDKALVLAECHRVLKPGGRLVCFEVCQHSDAIPHYPVPWATEASQSFLLSASALEHTLKEGGFRPVLWQEVGALCLDWFNRTAEARKKNSSHKASPLNLGLVMGKTAAQKSINLERNLREGYVEVIMAVSERISNMGKTP